MDSMLQKLEKYADNLENIVQQRTAELINEKHKTDLLLHRMLPPYASLIICSLEAIRIHGLFVNVIYIGYRSKQSFIFIAIIINFGTHPPPDPEQRFF